MSSTTELILLSSMITKAKKQYCWALLRSPKRILLWAGFRWNGKPFSFIFESSIFFSFL